MDNTDDEKRPQKRPRRAVTVYDAVAGRAGVAGFLPAEPYTSTTRDTATSSSMPIRPEEVLFRRKNAPTRYEEDDVYFQERHLPSHLKLPDSDLLKAIHAYASDFYGSESLRRQGGGKSKDWESMDETALTAMGILLEEAAAEALGDSGHLAFLEQEGAQQDRSSMAWNGKRWVKSVVRSKRNRFDIGSETEESVLEEDLDEQESSNQAGSGVEAGPSTLPIIQRKGKGRWTIVND